MSNAASRINRQLARERERPARGPRRHGRVADSGKLVWLPTGIPVVPGSPLVVTGYDSAVVTRLPAWILDSMEAT